MKDLLKRLLKRKEFKAEWAKPDALELRFLRLKKGLTQEQLAKMIGTKQESISRLENNPDNATLDFVGRIAYGLGYRAELKFKKI